MDGSAKAKSTSRSASKSPSREEGETSDASYRSRSLSGGRSKSASSRPSSRNSSKPRKLKKQVIESSDEDFVPSGAKPETRQNHNTRSKTRNLKKAEIDARTDAQNPGAMTKSLLETSTEIPSDLTDAEIIRQGIAQRAARLAAEKAAQTAQTSQSDQSGQAHGHGQESNPEDSSSHSKSLENMYADQADPSVQNHSYNQFPDSGENESGDSHHEKGYYLDPSTGEMILTPISGPSRATADASQGVVANPSGQGSQVAKGSYLDRTVGRHSPYQRPPGAKGNSEKLAKELAEAEALLDSLSSPPPPPQHSSSPIHEGGSDAEGGAIDGNSTIVVDPSSILGDDTKESVPEDTVEVVSENQVDFLKMQPYIQEQIQSQNQSIASDSSAESKLEVPLKPQDPLFYAGVYSQSLNNTVSDLLSQGDDKVGVHKKEEEGNEDELVVGVDANDLNELDYEPESETNSDSHPKRQRQSAEGGDDQALSDDGSTKSETDDGNAKGSVKAPAPETKSTEEGGDKPTQQQVDKSTPKELTPAESGKKDPNYKIPRIQAPAVATGSSKEISAKSAPAASSTATGAKQKKPPSQKKIHRKQNPEAVPDFLVIDPEVLPPSRDPRYLDRGYIYVDSEQWKADYTFLKLKLREARAAVAVKIFDTDTVANPSNFLRRFWAGTGVSKSRPLTDVVADILNSKNGWTEIYNNFANMEEGGRDWSQTLTLLQDMAIQICRTAAFKRTQLQKEQEEKEKKEEILKEAKKKGIASGSGAFKGSGSGKSSSNKSGRFDRTAKNLAAENSNASGGASSSANPQPGSSKAPQLPPPAAPPKAGTPPEAPPAQPAPKEQAPPPKPVLKPPQGRQKPDNGKSVSYSDDKKKRPTFGEVAQHAQKRVDTSRERAAAATDQEASGSTPTSSTSNPAKKTSAKVRLGYKKEQDYFLLDLCHKQGNTLKEVFPAGEDSGLALSNADGGADHDQVNMNIDNKSHDQADDSGLERSNVKDSSSSSQTTPQAVSPAKRTRVVIASVPDHSKGKAAAQDFTENDLIQFKVRLDKHIEAFNDQIDDEDEDTDPIVIMNPWVDKGKIIVQPQTIAIGNHIIEMVNNHVRLTGHKIEAGWNRDLPLMASISIRYESIADRAASVVIEDPKKGIARLNKWKLEGREIQFQSVSVDPAHPHVSYAVVNVSKRVCGLIQGQGGRLWIHGGQATAQWKGKDLVEGLEVDFYYQ